MPFINAISFLLLLISSNIGLAGISFPTEEKFDENQITLQVSEDGQELFESTLTTPSFFNHSYLTTVKISDFAFSSINRESEAERYVAFSRSIIPGLTLTKVIFPFHSFL